MRPGKGLIFLVYRVMTLVSNKNGREIRSVSFQYLSFSLVYFDSVFAVIPGSDNKEGVWKLYLI